MDVVPHLGHVFSIPVGGKDWLIDLRPRSGARYGHLER